MPTEFYHLWTLFPSGWFYQGVHDRDEVLGFVGGGLPSRASNPAPAGFYVLLADLTLTR